VVIQRGERVIVELSVGVHSQYKSATRSSRLDRTNPPTSTPVAVRTAVKEWRASGDRFGSDHRIPRFRNAGTRPRLRGTTTLSRGG
jgi:hypothetical protein